MATGRRQQVSQLDVWGYAQFLLIMPCIKCAYSIGTLMSNALATNNVRSAFARIELNLSHPVPAAGFKGCEIGNDNHLASKPLVARRFQALR